jgi:DNA-nicking Smr family endonuclease
MRPLPDAEDLRLWSIVASTVRPLRPSLQPSSAGGGDAPVPSAPGARQRAALVPERAPTHHFQGRSPDAKPLDAALHRRLSRGRDHLAARIDLHGMTQDAARAALTGFIERAVEDGWRAVLVITGKGTQGDGVLRRRVPDWLGEPPLAARIAGLSEAHRRHGGEGALYVALKRPR